MRPSDSALVNLRIAYEELRGGLYDDQPNDQRLPNALKIVETGGVVYMRCVAGEHQYLVQGRTQAYTVGETCPCADATKRHNLRCYHKAAVHLYKQWQLHQGEPMPPRTQTAISELELGLPPTTADARLAQSTGEASSAPDASQDALASDDAPPRQPEAKNEPYLPLPMGRLLRPLHAILADLRRPLPEACVPEMERRNNRSGNSMKIKYLHWYQVQEILNRYAPGWYGEVLRVDELKAMTLTYRITIPCAEGKVWRDGVGSEDREDASIDFGDRASNALADAVKKAAEQFGIGVWLKDRDETHKRMREHFAKEHGELAKALAEACEAAGLEKKRYIEALKAQACVTRVDYIPVAILQEAIATVEAYAASRKE